jgi:hypothetical protein
MLHSLPHPTAPAARRAGVLGSWCHGAAAAVAVPPAAAAAGLVDPLAALATTSIAAALAVFLHRAARATRRRCALAPELAVLPAVARERDRLTGPGRRHRLAAMLRRTAALRVERARDDRVVPLERLAPVRADLLALADAVLAAERADPVVLDEIEALLRDGIRSPLLNVALPAGELDVALRRVRFNLATASGQPRSSST